MELVIDPSPSPLDADDGVADPLITSTKSSGRHSIVAAPLESQPPRDRAMSTSGAFASAMSASPTCPSVYTRADTSPYRTFEGNTEEEDH